MSDFRMSLRSDDHIKAEPSPGDGGGAAGGAGSGGDDGGSLADSDGDSDGRARGISVAELHAALTASAPEFPAYAMRATEDEPSAGRASYVRAFAHELALTTRVLGGQPLRRSWATAAFLRAIRADSEWADALWVALGEWIPSPAPPPPNFRLGLPVYGPPFCALSWGK